MPGFVTARPPAQPDHTSALFCCWRSKAHRDTLTSYVPAASICGLYFGHPQARYFAVDRITSDQVEDYARRKGMTVAEVERWLAPNLAY
jgi:5-methyltetrahydrofolate--homocysteine methyltransferase